MIVRGIRNSSGDGTSIAEANPATNRLIAGPFIQLQNKGAADVNVKLKLGSREIYDVMLEAKTAIVVTDLPEEMGSGMEDEDLFVNLDVSVAVYYQIQVREVTF